MRQPTVIFYLLLCKTQSGLFEDNLAKSAFECHYEQLSSSLWPIFFLLIGLSWWNLFVCARWKRTVECSWWISLFEALLLDIEQHKADRVEKEYFDVTKEKMCFFCSKNLADRFFISPKFFPRLAGKFSPIWWRVDAANFFDVLKLVKIRFDVSRCRRKIH